MKSIQALTMITSLTLLSLSTPLKVAVAQERGQSSRKNNGRARIKSLAIVAFDFPDEAVDETTGYWRLQENKPVQIMTAELSTELSKFKGIQLVERKRIKEVNREIALTTSGKVDPKRAISFGKLIGADYLVLGEISSFGFFSESEKVPFSSYYSNRYGGDFIVNMRLIDSRTGAVVFSRRILGRIETKKLSKKAIKVSPNLGTLRAARSDAVRKMARVIVNELTPFQVVSLRTGRVYLNRGQQDGLKPGDCYALFRPGAPVIDETTGAVLVQEIEQVGQVKVISVGQRSARVEVTRGQAKVGDRLKKIVAQQKAKKQQGRPLGW